MNGRTGALTALHLLLVWAVTALVVPLLGLVVLAAGWAGGLGGAAVVLLPGVPAVVGLLALAGGPAASVVPLCGSVRRRLVWAVSVFVLGTLGVLAGVAAYSRGVDLGSGGVRAALTGVPYAVAAAFFVPGVRVRAGAALLLAVGVLYGGFAGPAQAEQTRHEAEAARYRERADLLYLADPPPGMRVALADSEAAGFLVDYRSAAGGPERLGLTVRRPLTPELRCPEASTEGTTCRVDEGREVVEVHVFPDGTRQVTLTRRHGPSEVEVGSQSLDEAGLRRVLDSVHPLSGPELEDLMRSERIRHHL
ncbi:hypothetical protein ACIA8O_19050 [Kitasatospora sp. NPDC051853]|uniref:hypothetical protein n=1 Tax=Kitasatospora sp. NPDC051853 TaxID=3364058 RepID=UPI0037B3AF91